ncbi:MAG: cation transporter [Magnetococcales bacterium]|nr:cation transporter [Magnetococcales bacterium]
MQFDYCPRCVVQAGWTDLACSVSQAVFRTLLGWISGSMGLILQGLYSFGDALAKGVTLISVQIAKRPPSKTFPFGSGKVLFVSSLTIGVGLLLGGLSLGLTSFSELGAVRAAPSLFTVLGVLLSAAASELMHRYLRCVARQNRNSALDSSARDNRLDAFSSVLVLLGIVLSNLGMPAADHIAALLVALMVLRIGSMITWDAIKGLLDVTVSREVLAEIARTARMTSGIQDIKLIRGRSLGESWEIYMHVTLDETLTVREGHEIVAAMKKNVQAAFVQVHHVWVITIPHSTRKREGMDYWSEHLFSHLPKEEEKQP